MHREPDGVRDLAAGNVGVADDQREDGQPGRVGTGPSCGAKGVGPDVERGLAGRLPALGRSAALVELKQQAAEWVQYDQVPVAAFDLGLLDRQRLIAGRVPVLDGGIVRNRVRARVRLVGIGCELDVHQLLTGRDENVSHVRVPRQVLAVLHPRDHGV